MKLRLTVSLILFCVIGVYAQICGSNRTMYVPYGYGGTHTFSDTVSVCLTFDDKLLTIDRGYDVSIYKFHTTKWFRKGCCVKNYPNAIDYYISPEYLYIDYWIFSNKRNILVYRERYTLKQNK